VDSHCHLDDDSYTEGVQAVMGRAHAAGVEVMINPGYDIASSHRAVANAREVPGIYALVGIHPHDATGVGQSQLDSIESLLGETGVVGIGEIGLDYYRDLSPRDEQMKVFRAQMEMAREHGMPVEIHNRDAHRDTLEVLREYAGRVPAIVMHCYSGSPEMAAELLKMGCVISIAGPVTFSNARKLVDVVKQVPLDSLMVETDAPYLTPVPHRGQRNEPAYVRHVAERIAEIKQIGMEQVAEATSATVARVFGISL